MKKVFCSQCGQLLPVTRKGLSKYGRIVDLIDPHECGNVVEPNWDIVPVPLPSSGNKKFAKKLDELQPTKDLRNLKEEEEEVKTTSTAPESILEHFRKLNL